jgi:site-specific recombinase XerD
MELHDLFTQFTNERRYITSVTEATQIWYQTSWRCLGSRISDLTKLNDVIVDLRKERPTLSEISINTYSRCINAFLRWAHTEGHLPALYKFPHLQEPKRERMVLSSDDIPKIKNWKPTGINDQRVRVMALIALDCGLRLTEIINMKKADVNLDQLLIRVMGKGRKERQVPMSIHLMKILFRWMDAEWLFKTSTDKLISRSNAQRDIKVMGKKLNIRISFHRLRHKMATNYLSQGGHISQLRRILGHSSILTTQKYEHLETRDLVNNFSNLSTLR